MTGRGSPVQGYGPVRNQVLAIVGAVNRWRRQTGYGRVPTDTLPRMRAVRRVFEGRETEQEAA